MGRIVDDSLEPGKLLDEFWFFGNLLDRKPKMSRSLSDPCTSSNFNHEMIPGKSFEETYESIKKLPERDESRQPALIRASSIKPGKKTSRKTLSDHLPRTPSLPLSLRAEEYPDEEMEFSMGKLIRQASLNNSGTVRGRAQPAKGSTPNFEGFQKLRPQRPINQIKTQKSLSHIESLHSQGFKDLGFDFDKKCLLKNVNSTVPGVREEGNMEDYEDRKPRRPHRSESAMPKWAAGKMSTEDMKAQLKFWARTVASNVRQEC